MLRGATNVAGKEGVAALQAATALRVHVVA
jgi:hypothetical protein